MKWLKRLFVAVVVSGMIGIAWLTANLIASYQPGELPNGVYPVGTPGTEPLSPVSSMPAAP